jgi:hypothetical protein
MPMVDHILITDKDPVVGNHRLRGEAVFPGVAYFDLLCQLFLDEGQPLEQIGIRNLAIFNPLIVTADRDVRLRVERRATGPASWQVELTGQDACRGQLSAEMRQYASAEVDCSQAARFAESFDVAALRAQAQRVYVSGVARWALCTAGS